VSPKKKAFIFHCHLADALQLIFPEIVKAGKNKYERASLGAGNEALPIGW